MKKSDKPKDYKKQTFKCRKYKKEILHGKKLHVSNVEVLIIEVNVLREIKKNFKIMTITSVSNVKSWDIPRYIVRYADNVFIVNKLIIMLGIVN